MPKTRAGYFVPADGSDVSPRKKWKLELIKADTQLATIGPFPEELWILILEKLVDSKDIENVFRAIPILSELLHKQKPSLLFDQVIPHLFPKYLYLQEASPLWKVSKRWRNAVDNVVTDSMRPYNHQKSFVTRNHFNFHTLPIFLNTNVCQDLAHFNSTAKMSTFRANYGECVSLNPFPGASISITDPEDVWESPKHAQEFFTEIVALFKQFGHHVEFFSSWWKVASVRPKAIMECLTHLPNLRSLSLSLFPPYQEPWDDLFADENNLSLISSLSKLESVSLKMLNPQFAHYLFRQLGKTSPIRKLDLQFNWMALNFQDDISFPQLTELCVSLANFQEVESNDVLPELSRLLAGVHRHSPHFRKLSLCDYQYIRLLNMTATLDFQKFVALIAPLKIECLELIFKCVLLEWTMCKKKVVVPSVKILALKESGQYLYSRCFQTFPNLEQVRVEIPAESGLVMPLFLVKVPMLKSLLSEQQFQFEIKFRHCLALQNGINRISETLFPWNELPNLKGISVHSQSQLTHQFVRELGSLPIVNKNLNLTLTKNH